MKNSYLMRNFIIFAAFLIICMGAVVYYIVHSSQDIELSDVRVNQTQNVIINAQELTQLIIATISVQRIYLFDRTMDNQKKYEDAKINLSSQIGKLRELTIDNPSQSSRMMEIEHLSLQFKDFIDDNLKRFENVTLVPTLKDYEEVFAVRDNMLRLSNDLLKEEYALLIQNENNLSKAIDRYQITLLIGSIAAFLIVLLFNWNLLLARSKISATEASMRESEERFRLAIRGSNDGIFDWDLKSHNIYWSPQYKQMLGFTEEDIEGSEEAFRRLLHPEDSESFWETFNNYINGNLSEFSLVYRMVGKSGREIWIHGRGKAIFDENRQPVRFIGAHTDISYIKEHERMLKDERDRAEAASAAKGEFLAHMSHEIRTPLTAVSGIAEILSGSDAITDKGHRKLIKTLRTSTETLKELINDILDFSKIESGEVELHNQKFVLGEMFEQVISIMSVKANEKLLDFSFDFDDLRGTVFNGDRQRLRQILINLIGNAIKFTESGYVGITARIEQIGDSHVIRIDVKDSGVGIHESAIPIIFEKFRQADSSISRGYGGTGLGLSISMSLAQIMGGTIKVESEQGRGSTFSLILPFAQVTSDSGVDISKVVRMQKLNDRLKAAIGEKKRILLVEDYEGNIVVLSYILKALNCNYDIAKTGLEAIKLWKEKHYDLVLMDIQMPEMDGLTASRIIRKVEDEQALPRTPIIGLTAHALIADKQKCIEAGMDKYLPKPIVEADLKNAILTILEEKQPTSGTQAA